MTPPQKLRELLKGVIALTVTPFKEDGSIDEEKLRDNVRYLIEGGASVIVVNGSCGECYAMSIEEQKQVIRAVVDEANGQVPVVAGTSYSGTDISVELSKYAEDVGADGVQVIPPYYYPANVIAHYRKISNSIDIGVIIYNNPEVIGHALTVRTLSKIMESSTNIVGIKDCTEDLITVSKVINSLGDKVAVLCGTGEALAPFFYLLGSPGTYSSIVNFAPQIPVEMHKAAVEGRYSKVMEIHKKLLPLFSFIKDHAPFIRVIKGAMEIVGRPAGPVRLPLTPLTKEEMKELEGIIASLGILDK